MPMSDEGVCVFEKRSRFPEQMKPSNIDHDWTLTLGFDGDVSRSDFLDGLKAILRDYWYAERTKNSSMSLRKGDLKTPISGQLCIYLSEARNLAAEAFKKRLPSGVPIESLELDVKVGFNSPKSLDRMFDTVYIDNSLFNEMNTVINRNDIVIKGNFKRGSKRGEVDWRTERSPAGYKCDLGRLAVVSKSNIQLTFDVTATVMTRGEPTIFEFGSGEYFSE